MVLLTRLYPQVYAQTHTHHPTRTDSHTHSHGFTNFKGGKQRGRREEFAPKLSNILKVHSTLVVVKLKV